MATKQIQDTRQLFLWLMGCVYMFAFSSLYVQIPGLYGPNGLTPIYNVLPKDSGNESLLARIHQLPSLVIFAQDLGLPAEVVMELCCIVGVCLALLAMIFQCMRCSLVFVGLWGLYLSVYKVGQVFMHFQWDVLLLETGVLTILVAPLNFKFWKRPEARAHDGSSLWLVKWLLFRLMFASGVVKLTSMCPTWWGLTALDWHYESQCIPTPLAWYAHQLPGWFQKLSVVGTYFIEIGVPFLFFVPVRSLRLFAFWNQVFFQLCIILTGNYNFFNLLTLTLCVSLLDDKALAWIPGWRRKVKLCRSPVPKDWSRQVTGTLCNGCATVCHALGRVVVFVGVVGGLIAATVYWFEVKLDMQKNMIHSNIGFTSEAFHRALSIAVPAAAAVGGGSLLVELLHALWDSVTKRGPLWKLWSLLQTIVMGGFIVIMFGISLPSLGVLDQSSLSGYLPPKLIQIRNTMDQFDITSSYGLFRRMTGVGGRPELVVEGTNDKDAGEWKEYGFLYKPNHVNKAPPFVAPHQPRLDWQMWFAALGNYQYNPWLVHLVYRLLIGQKEVLDLLAPPPFEKPPTFMRVQLYHYHYTEYNNAESLLNQSGPWWHREFKQEYMFTLTHDNNGLKEYLIQQNYLDLPVLDCSHPVCPLLDQLRLQSRLVPPHHLLLLLFTSAMLVSFTSAVLGWLMGGQSKKEVTSTSSNNGGGRKANSGRSSSRDSEQHSSGEKKRKHKKKKKDKAE